MIRFKPFTINIRGRLTEISRPQVMAIINATPDSFYAGSRTTPDEAAQRVAKAIADGADVIDVGACSTRPGAEVPTAAEEIERLRPVMAAIREVAPDIPLSVDTYRADVARAAVSEMGADIINDVSGGLLDPDMIPTVADLRVPYILMHMRGTPATMQQFTDYPDGVTAGVIAELSPRIRMMRDAGIADIIIDPGLGFAKTPEQNFTLLRDTPALIEAFGLPVLIGLSRKSMLTRTLGITSDEALEATVAADTIAMMLGAAVLRVHDPLACRQSVELFTRTFPLLP